jgi:hypothetical protein
MRIVACIGAPVLGLTGPAFADMESPWGFPVCQTKPDYERDKNGLPFAPPASRDIPQPFAHDRNVYAGIYQAAEVPGLRLMILRR